MTKRVPVTYTSTYADFTKTEKNMFDKADQFSVFLDDYETWTGGGGIIVALNSNSKHHQEVIDCETDLNDSEGRFLVVDIENITKEDMQYLFSKYGRIYK